MENVDINQLEETAHARLKAQSKQLEIALREANARVTMIKNMQKSTDDMHRNVSNLVTWHQRLIRCKKISNLFVRADRAGSIFFTIAPVIIVTHKDKTCKELTEAVQPVPLIELGLPPSISAIRIWDYVQWVANDGKVGGGKMYVDWNPILRRNVHKYHRPPARYPHPTINMSGNPCWGDIWVGDRMEYFGSYVQRALAKESLDDFVDLMHSYLEQDPSWSIRTRADSPFRKTAQTTRQWGRRTLGTQEAGEAKGDGTNAAAQAQTTQAFLDEFRRSLHHTTAGTATITLPIAESYTTITTLDSDAGDTRSSVGTDVVLRPQSEG